MAMGALVEPRVMLPVLKPPLFWVAVWRSVSVLRQATVWPTRRVAVAGENDMPPWSPRMEMTRSAVPVAGGTVVVVVVGFEGVEGVEPPPPQLGPSKARISTTRGKRRNRIGSPMNRAATRRPAAPQRNAGAKRKSPATIDKSASYVARAASGTYRLRKRVTAGVRRLLFDPVLREVVAERTLADPEQGRRVFLDPARAHERLLDALPLRPLDVRP